MKVVTASPCAPGTEVAGEQCSMLVAGAKAGAEFAERKRDE